jgi:hypothetical protein
MVVRALFLFVVFAFGGGASVLAQQSTPQPTPRNTPVPAEDAKKMIQRQRETDARFEALRSGGTRSRWSNFRVLSGESINNLYREPKKKELQAVAPDSRDLKVFEGFLKQSKTGLIKLVSDFGCAQSTKVIVVTEECLKYSLPGAGSSYSFRIENYRIRRLSDLTFADDSFHGLGVLSHSILVNIGDVPLENVTLQTIGLKFLTQFEPETDDQTAKEVDLSLMEGIEQDGFIYRRSLPALNDTTYALRSIAYKGFFYRAMDGIPYNELDFDKRIDIIVVFRIVRRDEGGTVTILWKELERKNSPKIKQQKVDSKENNEDRKLSAGESGNL